MIKRPELKTSTSRKFMNSVRYKPKDKKHKVIEEAKNEDNQSDVISYKNAHNSAGKPSKEIKEILVGQFFG